MHKTTILSFEDVIRYQEGSTWYFTQGPAKDGSEMEVFTIKDGIFEIDGNGDRVIHGHPPKKLDEMFMPIDLGAVIT
jgi:hypothetical protein